MQRVPSRAALVTSLLAALALPSAVVAATATTAPATEPATTTPATEPAPTKPPAPAVTHSVAVGDVTVHTAILWARGNRAGMMRFEIQAETDQMSREPLVSRAIAPNDFTAQVDAQDLDPATRYTFRAVLTTADGEESAPVEGTFRTAPEPQAKAPVRVLVGGDLGGGGYCRDREHGYRIFDAMAALEPDLFIANGDMIYADQVCPAVAPDGRPNVPGDFEDVARLDWTHAGHLLDELHAHWRYNRADPHLQAFLARTIQLTQWDDHEAINDFGLPWRNYRRNDGRPGYWNLIRTARDALFHYNPIRRSSILSRRHRLAREFRWGADLQVFLLDTRSYRSRNDLPDVEASHKTLLGIEQRDWLVKEVTASTATWKLISSTVPLAVPTGSDATHNGRDGFANGDVDTEGNGSPRAALTGYESELRHILRELDAADVDNVVFVATDVHHALLLRYEVDVDGDGDRLRLHEILSGPLSASQAPGPWAIDWTFQPIILYGRGGLDNFADLRFDRDAAGTPRLRVAIRDQQGRVLEGSELSLTAR